MIDIEEFFERGYIDEDERINYLPKPKGNHCNLKELVENRNELFEEVFEKILKDNIKNEIENFLDCNKEIKQTCEYYALKEKNKNKNWQEWDDKTIKQEQEQKRVLYYGFLAYFFEKQWKKLKSYANDHHVKLIGDVPIYVHLESADVYFNRDCFLLNEEGYPEFVSGFPSGGPDGKGQKWGHPIYNIKNNKQKVTHFIQKRFSYLLYPFDLVRIDHFKAFASFYKIPYQGEANDEHCEWVNDGIGIDVLETLTGKERLIAEDVGGENDEKVQDFLGQLNIPGMKIMQFWDETTKYPVNSIAYTGTHDNNTLLGYYQKKNENEPLQNYKKVEKAIRDLLASNSKIVIFPVQDLLIQDEDCRMNIPGTVNDNNWTYQLTYENMNELLANVDYFNSLITSSHNTMKIVSLDNVNINDYFGKVVITYHPEDEKNCKEIFKELEEEGIAYYKNPIDEKIILNSEYEDRLDQILMRTPCYVLMASKKIFNDNAAIRRLVWYQIGVVSGMRDNAILVCALDDSSLSGSPILDENLLKGSEKEGIVNTIIKKHPRAILKQKFYNDIAVNKQCVERLKYCNLKLEWTVDSKIVDRILFNNKPDTISNWDINDLLNHIDTNVKVVKFSFEENKIMDSNYAKETKVDVDNGFLMEKYHNEKQVFIIKDPITRKPKQYKFNFNFLIPIHNPLGTTLRPYFECRKSNNLNEAKLAYQCLCEIMKQCLSVLEYKTKDITISESDRRIYFSFNFASDNCIKQIKENGSIHQADFVYPQ